ncbi:MAG: LamG domain-containing protein [Candidatus Micrarchaeales archaeon]
MNRSNSGMPAQAAIEYLITHAWSILLIAIVLITLFQLGIFSQTYVPRANPGSCSVVRPFGAFSTTDISLQGICNGQLPKYALTFGTAGPNGIIQITENLSIRGNQITVAGWAYQTAIPACGGAQVIMASKNTISPPNTGFFFLGVQSSNHSVAWRPYNALGHISLFSNANVISLNTWYFIAGTYNGSQLGIYLNGTLISTMATSGNLMTAPNNPPGAETNIGSGAHGDCHYWQGAILDIQVYNASLNSASLKQLYLEGVGGAPINLPKLFGWWPLNGDSMDYSGDGLNGGVSNLSFSDEWVTTYKAP